MAHTMRCFKHSKGSVRQHRQPLVTAPRAIRIAEHGAYLEEVAVSQAPKHLPDLIKVLEAQGHSLLSPSDRQGLHPLVIPLALAQADAVAGASFNQPSEAPIPQGRHDAALVGAQAVVGLLRWPQPRQHGAMPLPVVAMSRDALGVKLLARSVDEYLHRLLAEEDVVSGGAGGPLAAAAGAGGAELYRPGAQEAAGMKPEMYIIRKVGMFPDVCEALAAGHLSRGDATSAMVAAEWYMRNDHFSNWARPFEFASELFAAVPKRGEEARDMARFALRTPWWALRSYERMAERCAIPGGPADIKYALSDEAAAASSGKVNKFDYKEPRTEPELALQEATTLMDYVAAGQTPGGYAAVQEPLAEQYRRAGLEDVANFISAA